MLMKRLGGNILFHPLPFGCPLCQWIQLERGPPPVFLQEMLDSQPSFLTATVNQQQGCPRLPLSAIRLRPDNSYSYLACSRQDIAI